MNRYTLVRLAAVTFVLGVALWLLLRVLTNGASP